MLNILYFSPESHVCFDCTDFFFPHKLLNSDELEVRGPLRTMTKLKCFKVNFLKLDVFLQGLNAYDISLNSVNVFVFSWLSRT